MMWALYGLLHSMLRAAFAETNRVFRVNGWHLTFMHAVLGTLMLAPFAFFMPWPDNDKFYLAASVIGLIFTVGTVIMLSLAGERKGRVTGLYMPLEAAAGLALWALVAPGMWEFYADSIPLTVAILVALVASSIALTKVRGHDITLETFIIVAPVGMTYALSGVVIKMVVEEAHVLPMALNFVFVLYAVMAAAMLVMLALKRKFSKEMIAAKSLKAGALTGLFGVMAYMTFIIGIVKADNPGYVSMLAMLLPVWLLVVHKMIRLDDDADPRASVVIAGACGLLIGAVALFS
jgi:hypothetical protein